MANNIVKLIRRATRGDELEEKIHRAFMKRQNLMWKQPIWDERITKIDTWLLQQEKVPLEILIAILARATFCSSGLYSEAIPEHKHLQLLALRESYEELEPIRQLTRPEFAQQVRDGIEAFDNGKGSYLEKVHCHLAAKLGYSEQEINEGVRQPWLDALERDRKRKEVAAKPKTFRRITNSATASSFLPATQPKADEEQKDTARSQAEREEARVEPKRGFDWPEAPTPPANANALECLTYPRGLLGHVVEYIHSTAQLPDRFMSLAGALSALGKCLDRKVLGPTGNSTILYILLIAETGSGKQHIINCIRIILRAAGMEEVIVASGIASVQAIEQILEGKGELIPAEPSPLILIDELWKLPKSHFIQRSNRQRRRDPVHPPNSLGLVAGNGVDGQH